MRLSRFGGIHQLELVSLGSLIGWLNKKAGMAPEAQSDQATPTPHRLAIAGPAPEPTVVVDGSSQRSCDHLFRPWLKGHPVFPQQRHEWIAGRTVVATPAQPGLQANAGGFLNEGFIVVVALAGGTDDALVQVNLLVHQGLQQVGLRPVQMLLVKVYVEVQTKFISGRDKMAQVVLPSKLEADHRLGKTSAEKFPIEYVRPAIQGLGALTPLPAFIGEGYLTDPLVDLVIIYEFLKLKHALPATLLFSIQSPAGFLLSRPVSPVARRVVYDLLFLWLQRQGCTFASDAPL
jgi:hypothetical protein